MHRLAFLRCASFAVLGFAGMARDLAAAGPFAPASPSTAACVRVALDPRPEWVVGAAWSADGHELVVADILGGTLWRYGRDGQALGSEIHPSRDGLGWVQPTHIATLPKGFVLTDGHRLVWLDERLRPHRAVDPDSFAAAPEGRLDAFWTWSVGGDRLFAIGDAQRKDGSWIRAFVSAPLSDPAQFRVLREAPLADRSEVDFYVMGNPHVAVLDGTGYFLAMTAPPRIFADGDPPRWLHAFPTDIGRPALPRDEGPRNYAMRFALYERTAAPVAIFAADHRLFLLTRNPVGSTTRWMLHRIDPAADRIERSFVLPSTANHLVLAPGSQEWAVIEKGPVKEKGSQDVHHLLLIPAARLNAPAAAGAVDPCS